MIIKSKDTALQTVYHKKLVRQGRVISKATEQSPINKIGVSLSNNHFDVNILS